MSKPRIKFIDPDFRKDPKTNLYCCRCQKDIKNNKYLYVYLQDGGMNALHPDDVRDHKFPDDIGYMPIGSDCAKIIGLDFVIDKK